MVIIQGDAPLRIIDNVIEEEALVLPVPAEPAVIAPFSAQLATKEI